MANWIRDRRNWFRTNNKWVDKAYESAKSNNANWSTYYGKYGEISNSWGLNPDNPFYNPTRRIENYHPERDTNGFLFGAPRNDGCDECSIIADIINCGGLEENSPSMQILKQAMGTPCTCPGVWNPQCCGCIQGDQQNEGDNCIPIAREGCPPQSISELCAARVTAGENWNPCTLGACVDSGICLSGCPCCGTYAVPCEGDDAVDSGGEGCADDQVNGGSGCVDLECDEQVECSTLGVAEYGLVCNGCTPGEEVFDNAGNSLGECQCENITDPACQIIACPCGVNPGSCYFGESCISPCCPPGEEGCCPCPDGTWVPCDGGCPETECTCPNYGDMTMPEDYCFTCEYCDCVCNNCDCSDFNGAPGGYGWQCTNADMCLWCELTGRWINPSEEDCDDPPDPCDCSSQGPCAADSDCGDGLVCYEDGCHDPECVYCECTDRCQPIWFDCECEVNPCEDPTDPECYGGPPVVCYDYNSNDPIYYSASSLGPSVTVEYTATDTTTGGTYSYGSVALLCEIQDQFQLCVFVEDASGNETQLAYANCGNWDDSGCTTNNSFIINETASTITLSPTTSVPGGGKLIMRRCTDNNRMMLSFTEGAKLSANDINASLHQLLFLIQEKEFESNTYYNVANAADIAATSYFEIKSNDPVVLAGKWIQLKASDGTTRQYVFFNTTGLGHDTGDTGTNPNDVIVQVHGLSTTAAVATQLENAIESANGHNSKILVNDYTGNDSKKTLTQAVVGTAGNTSITVSGIDDTVVIIPSIFTGGTDYGGSALITFSPATTLPVNFNFAGASAGEVLIWDGSEVSATSTPPRATLAGLTDVDDTVVATTNDVLTFTSSGKWKAAAPQGGDGGSSIDLSAYLRYEDHVNGDLDDFWTSTLQASHLGKEVSEFWAQSNIATWVNTAQNNGGTGDTGHEKSVLPNAITAFGLGLFATQEWVRNALNLSNSVNWNQMFDTWYDSKSAADGGNIAASFEWDLSKGVGRKWASEAHTRAKHSSPYWGIEDILQLSTSASTCSRAYFETLNVIGDSSAIRRVRLQGIPQATGWQLYSQKCRTSGIQSHKKNASGALMSGQPEVDHYFSSLKNAVSLADWTTANNWPQNHPLSDRSGGLDYTEGITEAFKADYVYATLDASADKAGGTYNTAGTGEDWYTASLNMPSVITYYLGTLYDADSAAGNADNTVRYLPEVLEWKGNFESIINPDILLKDDAAATDDEFYTTRQFLRSIRTSGVDRAGSMWYFHKWFIRSGNAASGIESEGTWMPEFNPFDGSNYGDVGGHDVYIRPNYNDGTGAGDGLSYNAGYSFVIESNKVFSWFLENSPPMYDDYVFKVTMDGPVNQGNYHVNVDIHEHVDGCTQLGSEDSITGGKRLGDDDCSTIGVGGTNIMADGTHRPGQHLYPADYYPDYVAIWNQVDFSKIICYSRNHQASSFEIVLKIPRFVRIGVIDRYFDADQDDAYGGGADAKEFGPLSLELLAEGALTDTADGSGGSTEGFRATDWSDDTDGSGDGNPPNAHAQGIASDADSDTGSGLLVPKTIASVSTESAVQFIRLGIPSNMMLKFVVLPTATSLMSTPS